MTSPYSSTATCWTLIRAAAAGETAARERFALVYEPVVRTWFGSRWRNGPMAEAIDDAVQDVFVESFRNEGFLSRAEAARDVGFRGFLYGVTRNVARRHEARRQIEPLDGSVANDETAASGIFDRAFARALMQEAAREQARSAGMKGPDAVRRVELLAARFGENLPIREIAARWQVDPAWLHHQYATARDEFHSALREVVAFHMPASSGEGIDAACQMLLGALKGNRD